MLLKGGLDGRGASEPTDWDAGIPIDAGQTHRRRETEGRRRKGFPGGRSLGIPPRSSFVWASVPPFLAKARTQVPA